MRMLPGCSVAAAAPAATTPRSARSVSRAARAACSTSRGVRATKVTSAFRLAPSTSSASYAAVVAGSCASVSSQSSQREAHRHAGAHWCSDSEVIDPSTGNQWVKVLFHASSHPGVGAQTPREQDEAAHFRGIVYKLRSRAQRPSHAVVRFARMQVWPGPYSAF